MDLRDSLNAKRNQEGDLRAKLNGRKAAAVSKVVVFTSLINCMACNEQRETAPRYQTPFSQEIEGLDPLEKFTPLRFTLYDGKFTCSKFTNEEKLAELQ